MTNYTLNRTLQPSRPLEYDDDKDGEIAQRFEHLTMQSQQVDKPIYDFNAFEITREATPIIHPTCMSICYCSHFCGSDYCPVHPLDLQ